jgi:ATP-binding cassette, subfamily B, bacterial
VIPDAPGNGREGVRDLRWAFSFVVPYRGVLLLVVGLNLVSTLLALYLPYLAKELVDRALLGGDTGALYRITGLFAGITVVGFGINVASGLRYAKVSADILFDMRLEVYRHLQCLSPRFWARTPLGEVVSRINNDVGEIQRVTAEMALGWFGNVLYLVGTVGMLIWLDWPLFLVSIAFLPLATWALVHYRRRLEGRIHLLRARSSEIGSFLIESLQGMRAVTGGNAQGREVDRFRDRNAAFVTALMGMQRLRYLAGGLPGILLSLGTAAVFLYGGHRVAAGTITLGTFVAFLAYQMRLLTPVQGLMGIYANLASVRVSLQRVRSLLDTLPDVMERDDPLPLPSARGEVRLEGVTFSHGREDDGVLQGVDLHIRSGEVVAVVGRSGSGKSTLADLLTRQIDPDAGRVSLDGHDLRDLALADVRRHVVTVEQDAFLFHASVADNLKLARPDAHQGEVEAAASAAGLHHFVAGLPEGYGTLVGERGSALSAGERQRLALARAFLADPAVLILDESTANLDRASEVEVIRGFSSAMRGRTTVLISHRRELVMEADRVLVMERGRVVEEGPPRELARTGAAFRRIFQAGASQGSGEDAQGAPGMPPGAGGRAAAGPGRGGSP